MAQQDQRITEDVNREYGRLRNFIRKRVADPGDAEDILQDVFYELVDAYRLLQPIEQVTSWLFQVARNRIVDLFRRKERERQRMQPPVSEEGTALSLDEFLPSPDGGPDTAYIRSVLVDELDAALDELPEEQREVFVLHELMGYSFSEISNETGVGVNTLLSRKHYAVMRLRERLRSVYDEFMKK